MIMGIGARRGVSEKEVIFAVEKSLSENKINLSEIEMLASSTLKKDEEGLLSAAQTLGKEIRFLPDEIINENEPESKSEASRFGLKGVAEPAALALSKNHQLVMKKKVYGRVTIAIAK
ncbi:cobalamin biosynthesis protein [Methanolapillus ohkumae]|uniref:Cobalt-precorrin-5A hydrolase n=1 Tax=Methanolapillus ohkumae TaxID=3028298 RepID=A0AA96ZVQ5_9EURY|nr:Cobalt-precorrin-5A hydrolase [Methanosarcinaceae archaeon Am2]